MREDAKSGVSILIIMGGKAGRFVQCIRALAAIRMHHASAHVTAILDGDLCDFAALSPFFDEVLPAPSSTLALAREISKRQWQRVYDFDGNGRSNWARRLSAWFSTKSNSASKTEWVGPAPAFESLHESDLALKQVELAGVSERPPVSLAWVSRSASKYSLPFALNQPFVIMALDTRAGSQSWELKAIIECCELIQAQGHRPVFIGENSPGGLSDSVREFIPFAADMTGSASFEEVVFMAWAAAGAIGCDNDMMHLVTAAGCKSVVLYDSYSDAARTGHLGADVTILRRHVLAAISPIEATQALYREAVA